MGPIPSIGVSVMCLNQKMPPTGADCLIQEVTRVSGSCDVTGQVCSGWPSTVLHRPRQVGLTLLGVWEIVSLKSMGVGAAQLDDHSSMLTSSGRESEQHAGASSGLGHLQ